MARYAIRSGDAFGIAVGKLRAYAKSLGKDHDPARALWASGFYEARMPAAFVAEPARVTPVLWALRLVGLRSPELYESGNELARRLALSEDPTQRWIGKSALRELASPAAEKRLARKAAKR